MELSLADLTPTSGSPDKLGEEGLGPQGPEHSGGHWMWSGEGLGHSLQYPWVFQSLLSYRFS